jgi:stress response protein YsnF
MNKSSNSGAEPGSDPQQVLDKSKKIQVIEEFATITKEVIETGKVRVIKSVTEETININVPIINESYEVKHVAVPHKVLDEPPVPLIQQGDTTIITVVREISVVVKKYEIIDEIHITKHLTQTPLTHEISLRKENVHVDRIKNT